ncbi:hypothetical protein DCO58_07305 [Helicobacter saguini]|uniref:Campylobacter invasion antigen D C-terminal domain-containing protein n=1 Tax=Helicobacter saguini TaxID=1548018 RepID=A0A347VN89_9HELI|nr:hypothetical protein [Helicobacter saguini]MWV61860.1 hypothetical protein [Helicobacter saguini]MWV67465.1 hypothetical protein [Helicobacter saguini]MWV69816.1 hypothetical protein [Helicobacter saguini]MWV72966.1 hypothetical protein [Helicobacter saguini]TLD95654.1 hypothetical protein LS64_002025 [Helicobacter saguini]
MELKDVVLQTLNEIENSVDEKGSKDINIGINTGEVEFLQSFKERIFVLFEGLKNNDLWIDNLSADDLLKDSKEVQASAKLDLILGFLQFQLALIDSRLEALDKRNG